jgi:hypothetical protein
MWIPVRKAILGVRGDGVPERAGIAGSRAAEAGARLPETLGFLVNLKRN